MAKDEEERSDGLEIISIGGLYTGAWDKKYWSSSRGKDRYPFPIGYKAVRTCNGITYQMEIHEGNKGPSFSITSTDGLSCSGQTPDMAWDIFQKKGCPRIKLWHGKRFSCKIDGVEFFGFKNALVQRLLRELVTHNGLTAERFTSGSISEDSANKNKSSYAEPCIGTTDLTPLPNLETPQPKGKTSRKLTGTNPNLIDAASCKKKRPKDKFPNDKVSHDIGVHDSGTLNSEQKNHNDRKHEPSSTSLVLNEKSEIQNDARASIVPMNMVNVVEEESNSFIVDNDLSVTSFGSSDYITKSEESPNKEEKLGNFLSTVTNLEIPKQKSKRTRKVKASKPNLDVTNCRKIQSKDGAPDVRGLHDEEVHDKGTSYVEHKDHNNSKLGPSLTSVSNEELEIDNDARTSVALINLDTVIERKSNPFPVKDVLPMILCHSSDPHVKGEEPPHVEEKLLKSISTGTKLEIPQVKGKRNRKVKRSISNPTDVVSCKWTRSKDESCDDRGSHDDGVRDKGTSDSGRKTHKDQPGPSLTSSASNEEPEIHNDARAPIMSVNLENVTVVKSNPFPADNYIPLTHYNSSNPHSKEKEPPHKKDNRVNSMCSGATTSSSKNENPLDRFMSKNEEPSLSVSEEPKDVERSVEKNPVGIKDVDLCVPDSLESLQDRTSDSQTNCQKEKEDCNGKSELVSGIGSMTITETTASESPQGEKTCESNENSEKSSFDSAGEDIKSMMSFLLPQALPLLSSKKKLSSQLITFSRKKRRVLIPLENSIGTEKIQTENKEPDHGDNVCPEGQHAKHPLLNMEEKDKPVLPNPDQGSGVLSSGHETTVVPDSFCCDEACSDDPHSNIATVDEKSDKPNRLRLPAKSSALENSSICHAGSSLSDKYSVELLGRRKNRPESVLGDSSGTGNNLCKRYDNTLKTSNDFLCRLEIQTQEKELETSNEHNRGATDDNSTGTLSSRGYLDKEICVTTLGITGNSSLTEHPKAATLTRQDKRPLSESIICRNPTDDFALQTNAASKLLPPSDVHPVSSLHPVVVARAFDCPLNNKINAELLDTSASCFGRSKALVGKELPRHSNHMDRKNVSTQKPVTSSSRFHNEVAEGSWLNSERKMGLSNEPSDLCFVGRYVQPFPISLVLLSTNEEELCICVLCGALSDQDRKLFMYRLSMKQEMLGTPSFICHTPILLPHSKDAFGREISMDRTCLQLTPDGHSLVLSNSVKAPCCRKGDFQCPCSACISGCSERAGLKVVQVKNGYISVVVKLMTTNNVLCILVCEPNYLIGIEESGILHLWVMNSAWSALIEECDLSTSDCIFPCIVDLKRIPNSASLVLSHNGFGEFGLWDISKRIFVARFSSPSTSLFNFLPISVFKWQKKDIIFTKPCNHKKEQITEIMGSIRKSLSKQDDKQSSNTFHGDDVAIWILLSSTCNTDTPHEFQSSHRMNNIGLWRLGLLVENKVILGSALDHSATAIGVSTGNGIMGTNAGVTYMWDLSSGTKLCDLPHLQGASISCIATDESKLGPVAIAGGDQLLVYVHSQESRLDANVR